MYPYSIILFIVAIIYIIVSILIYKGNTNLIHYYHQNNITDKEKYGKSFGKAMLSYPTTMILSGLIALNINYVKFSVLLLIIGLISSTFIVYKVQKKYNNSVF